MKWHHSPREKLNAVVLLSSKQTVPKYEGKPYWLWIELGFNSVFSIEMMMRLCAARTWENVLKDAYFVFDCAAVIPFWVEVVTKVVSPGAGGARAGLVQMLKALRMLRLLKLSRQYDGSIVIYRAMRVSMAALGVPFFFLLVAVIVFASFIYYLEKEAANTFGAGDLDDESDGIAAFRSIPHAIWFMMVTMTTVGCACQLSRDKYEPLCNHCLFSLQTTMYLPGQTLASLSPARRWFLVLFF